MGSLWHELIGNLSAATLAVVGWRFTASRSGSLSRIPYSMQTGLAFGLAAVVSMLLAVEIEGGIRIDVRLGLLAVASLYGGPLGGALAFVLSSVTRLALGGPAALDAVAGMALVCVLGAIASVLTDGRILWARLVAATIALLGACFLILTTLPAFVQSAALEETDVSYVVLNLCALLAGVLIMQCVRSAERERTMLLAALAQAPDYFYVKDRHSKFVAVNANTAALNHFPSTEAMNGLDDFALVPANRASRLYEEEQEVMGSIEPMVDVLEQIGERTFVSTKVPLLEADGTVMGLVGVTRDVTDREALVALARKNSDQLNHALESMSDGFAIFNDDGVLELCNEQYRRFFPFTSHLRKPGATIRELLEESLRTGEILNATSESIETWPKLLRGEAEVTSTVEINMCDGRWFAIKVRRSGERAILVMSDITDLKTSEAVLREQAEALRSIANIDPLTGLSNRRSFDNALVEATRSGSGLPTPVSVLMIDVDHFKAFNDTYGHHAGDDCLRLVADCLKDTAKRKGDFVARLGGEEFVALLPATSEEDALALAQSFRSNLLQHAVPHAASPLGVVTVSVGVASDRRHLATSKDAIDLMQKADAALYAAKRGGRNRVNSWTEEPVAPFERIAN